MQSPSDTSSAFSQIRNGFSKAIDILWEVITSIGAIGLIGWGYLVLESQFSIASAEKKLMYIGLIVILFIAITVKHLIRKSDDT